MDETNVCLAESQVTSISSINTASEESVCSQHLTSVRTRICLIGEISNDSRIIEAAQVFGVPVVSSASGSEFINDGSWDTVFVLEDFVGPVYEAIHASEQRILGPTALQQFAEKGQGLPNNSRPLYNLAMSGLVICFTGFRKKDELNRLINLIHNMGGSIRKDMVSKVTHLIANNCGGDKYQYAVTFRVPVMGETWVHSLWERRNDIALSATSEEMALLLNFHHPSKNQQSLWLTLLIASFISLVQAILEHLSQSLVHVPGVPCTVLRNLKYFTDFVSR